MLRKFFAYGSIIASLVALSQCCTKSVEDVTAQALQWEGPEVWEQELPSAKASQCATCFVPSEEAVYLLSDTGAGWQFTQSAAEGGLDFVSIPDVPSVRDKSFFPFSAGPAGAQKLHVGSIDAQKKQVIVQQYNGTTWETAGSYPLAEADKFTGTACALGSGGASSSVDGLIILAHRVSSAKSKVLVYNAEEQSFKDSDEWIYESTTAPKAAVQLSSTAILVGRTGDVDHNAPEPVVKIVRGTKKRPYIVQKEGRPEMLSLFLLQPNPHVKRAVWAMQEEKDNSLKLYTLETSGPAPVGELPEETEGPQQSWVLPFSDAVYVVAKYKDESLVYYRGSLKKSDN